MVEFKRFKRVVCIHKIVSTTTVGGGFNTYLLNPLNPKNGGDPNRNTKSNQTRLLAHQLRVARSLEALTEQSRVGERVRNFGVRIEHAAHLQQQVGDTTRREIKRTRTICPRARAAGREGWPAQFRVWGSDARSNEGRCENTAQGVSGLIKDSVRLIRAGAG